ncbi:MAG: hypothetical protein WD904_04810 [Dehalococcoidia bacterium]
MQITSDDVRLRGNFIGTDASGTIGIGNDTGIQVEGARTIIGGTDGWTPGGVCTGDCNLISGHSDHNNDFSIFVIPGSADTVIQGNMFGVNAEGTSALPNGTSVIVSGSNAVIGGASPVEGNLIAGTVQRGVRLASGTATIQGNLIGTNSTGTATLTAPNPPFPPFGITVDNAQNVVIGGGSPGARNVIADIRPVRVYQSSNTQIRGNFIGIATDGVTQLGLPAPGDAGVWIEGTIGTLVGGIEPGQGNTIAYRETGVMVSGNNGVTQGNQIRGNSIHSNVGPGIDTADGGNGEPQPPVVTTANQSGASGTASALYCANSMCAVDIYSDNEDEGRSYEGSTQTDLAGNWTFSGSLSGPNVTATITNDGGNTSEFSAPFTIDTSTPTPNPSPTPTPTPTSTATGTASATASPTPTPTGGPLDDEVPWGDANCSGESDPVDSLLTLRFDAGLSTNTGDCPPMGEVVEVANASPHPWGDVDCSGEVNPVDSLKLLRFDAGLPVAQEPDCPPIGDTVSVLF